MDAISSKTGSGERVNKSISISFQAFALLTSAIVLAYAIFFPIDRPRMANLVMGTATMAFYLLYTRDRFKESDGPKPKLIGGAALLTGVVFLASTIYVHFVYERWLSTGTLLIFNNVDLVVGAIIILVATHVIYVEYGGVLAAVVVSVLLYGLLGNYFPGILGHAGYSVQELIARQTVALDGVYSFILQIIATWVAIFLILAGLVEGYGGFDYIKEGGLKIARRSKNGLVQTAVFSSMVIGTMMGAAVSNVAVTGSFTIPLMKDRGVPPSVAGAIESVASTGGQILPPIMGTAAFLMADIVGIPFSKIVVGGFLPAVLFYMIVAVGIQFRTNKNQWIDDIEEGGNLSVRFLLEGLQYLLPILVLAYVLVELQFDPLTAGMFTIETLALTTFIRYTVVDRAPLKWVTDTIRGLIRGGEILAPFMALGGGLGIVINIYGSTGLGQKIALNLMLLAGGILIVALLIVMFVSILFGMGMPTPAAYILVATVLAPALVRLGTEPLVAHMYVFYFALLSALTPPVAVPIAMATTISGAGFWPTVKESLQFGIWLFLIPYMFLVNPSLILWSFPQTIIQFIFVSSGCIALVYTSTGYNGFAAIGPVQRGVAFVIGMVAIFGPTTLIQSFGFAVIVVFTLISVLGVKRERIPNIT